MTRGMALAGALIALGLSIGPGAAVASAGQGRRAVPGPLAGAGVSPAEIQELFDAYIVMQAQRELELTDDQFAGFLTKVRALQEVRRRGQMQRGRLLLELSRLSRGDARDEALRTQLKNLAELDARIATDTKQATDAVDQVLDLRQQARFRVFEEQMERRKVELLLRARQRR